MDDQLCLFKRQYFQLFEPAFLEWPPKQLLRDSGAQEWLYTNLFDADKIPLLPPKRYQLRVLKTLIAKVEESIADPEEDEISDNLVSHFSALLIAGVPPESAAVQERAFVTYTCLPDSQNEQSGSPHAEPTLSLLERRHLISGSTGTGYRTWEAALHLGSYLLTEAGSNLIRGKNVIELGAGTGFLSILCAKHLGAKHVTATDGDESIVEALKENLFLNDVDETNACVLKWGRGLKGTWVEDECLERPYEIVLGADIIYDKTAVSPLVSTLRFLFDLVPNALVLISGAVRNIETFDTFRHACARQRFNMTDLEFDPKPMREQRSLFYATAVPLRALSIRRPDS